MARRADRWIAALSLAVLAFSSCKPNKSAPSCSGEINALKGWVKQLHTEGPGCALPEVNGALSLDRPPNGYLCTAPLISVDARMTTIDGQLAAKTSELVSGAAGDELKSLLARKRGQAEALGASAPRRIAIHAGGDTPWGAIATLAQQSAAAKLGEIAFLFKAKSALTPPSGSKMTNELKELSKPLDPSEPAPDLSLQPPDFHSRIFAQCPGIDERLKPFSTMSLPPEQKRPLFHEAMLAGLQACDCKANMGDVRGLIWAQMDRFRAKPTFSAVIVVAAAGDTAATTLSLPAATPWHEAYKRVLAAADSGNKLHLEAVP